MKLVYRLIWSMGIAVLILAGAIAVLGYMVCGVAVWLVMLPLEAVFRIVVFTGERR